jgi:hypothetical protein
MFSLRMEKTWSVLTEISDMMLSKKKTGLDLTRG